MISLELPSGYSARLKAYTEFLEKRSDTAEQSYSDYWKEHSTYIHLVVDNNRALLDGRSGNYIPHSSALFKHRLARFVRTAYKSSVLKVDRLLGVSSPSWASTSVTFDMAYDLVMQRHPYMDYDDNPSRLDPLELSPTFATSKELRKNWFLKDRFFPEPTTYFAAYLHSVLCRYMPNDAKHYLEIGAGNGNLASLFMHYQGLRAVIVDLPETLLLSSSFLGNVFPEAKILLPHELDERAIENLEEYDLVLITPAQAELLPDGFFDLAVNVHSMQEMPHAEIDRYFELVQRVTKHGGVWGNVNRVEKVLSKTGRPVRAFEFPYRRQNKVLCQEIDRFIRLIQSDSSILHIEQIQK